jgi:hypothetical protein
MQRNISLNPTLARLLEAYELEHLTALVGWLEPDVADVSTEVPLLDTISLKEDPLMSSTPHLPIITEPIQTTEMALNELVEFSLVNEFGTTFQNKTYFDWLHQGILKQFATKPSLH